MPLSIREVGNQGSPLMFFIHGWPDSADLWQEQWKHFSKSYHCFGVTLPGFGDARMRPAGFDFPELVELLYEAILQNNKNAQSVILVGHDWGAYLCYLIERKYPELVSEMITFDVGGHFETQSWYHKLVFVSYQWWLATAFIVGRVSPMIGNLMTRGISVLAGTPRGKAVSSQMNYLYFYFWRSIFFKKYRAALLDRYRPHCPTLYLYGAKKPFHFHSATWEQIVAQTPHGRSVPISGTGHWLTLEAPDRVHRLMDEWLLQMSKSE